MALITTPALLLRAHAFGETSRVLRFLTRDRGIVGVMARGVRSSKTSSGLDTFAGGTLTLYFKETRDLQTLKEFGVDAPRRGLGREPLRLAAASVLAELILRHGGEAEAGTLFRAMSGALDALDHTPADRVPGVLLREGWGMVDQLGYHPLLAACSECGRPLARDEVGRFDFVHGGVRCAVCGEGTSGPRVGPGARAQLAGFLEGVVPDPLEHARAHLVLLSDFIAVHLAGGRPLDSFRVFAAFLPPSAP